jgi:hypothetical protein
MNGKDGSIRDRKKLSLSSASLCAVIAGKEYMESENNPWGFGEFVVVGSRANVGSSLVFS